MKIIANKYLQPLHIYILRGDIKILCPGAGLGRLAFECARMGKHIIVIQRIGVRNETILLTYLPPSIFLQASSLREMSSHITCQLLPASFSIGIPKSIYPSLHSQLRSYQPFPLLFSSSEKNQFKIHPFIHQTCNNMSDENQMRAVLIPDVVPRQIDETPLSRYAYHLQFYYIYPPSTTESALTILSPLCYVMLCYVVRNQIQHLPTSQWLLEIFNTVMAIPEVNKMQQYQYQTTSFY